MRGRSVREYREDSEEVEECVSEGVGDECMCEAVVVEWLCSPVAITVT